MAEDMGHEDCAVCDEARAEQAEATDRLRTVARVAESVTLGEADLGDLRIALGLLRPGDLGE